MCQRNSRITGLENMRKRKEIFSQMFCQRPKTEDSGRSLIKQKNRKNASLPKIIHNGIFSSQIYVFYSSAFKSKTEKIENFSENSKKSLTQYSIGLFSKSCDVRIASLYCNNQKKCCKFVIEFLFSSFFFCSKSTFKKSDNCLVKFIWLFNVK